MDKQLVWERFGLTRKEWELITESDREKLTGQNWHTVPCILCDKPVLVSGEIDPLTVRCMAHEEVNNVR